MAFLFTAALAVARIHASQVTMDAKIRDDSDLSQVKPFFPLIPVARFLRVRRYVASWIYAPDTTTRRVSLNRHAGTTARARVAFK